jgi:DNA-binding CsgD family transcriptional regulator
MANRILKLIMTRCKQGRSLSQISQLTEMTIDEVKETLGHTTGLTPKEVSIVFRMKEEGLSPTQISQEFDVDLPVLQQFLSQETTPVIRDTVLALETQIETLFRQGKRPHEIASVLGMNERTVLAYALGSESKTQFNEASEPASGHFRPPPTTTEQPPKSQLTKTWPIGDSYSGELLNDKPHGRGFMQYADGRT